MIRTPRQFIDACGGYRAVAPRVGIKPTTLHTHISTGTLPAKIFKACCDLAAEKHIAPPQFEMFSFVHLEPPVGSVVDVTADAA